MLKISRLAALLLAGAIQGARGAHDEARGLLQRFLASHPRHLHASKLLAAAHLQLERPADALTLLRPLIDTHPDDADLLALAGEASLRSGQFEAAAAHFARASRLRPDDAPLRTGLALGYIGSGQHERALAELEQVIALYFEQKLRTRAADALYIAVVYQALLLT